MTYRLYNRTGSGGFPVEVALLIADASFELISLDSRPGTPLPDSFKEINPWGQVPTLVLPDGSTMTESAAILIYLASSYPRTALAPIPGTPAYARFLRWLIFASVNIYEALLRSIYPFRFTSDRNPEVEQATQTAAIQRTKEGLDVLNAAIDTGPFLLGSEMSIADVYIAMLYHWAKAKGVSEAPRLQVLQAGVMKHEVVGPVWERHFKKTTPTPIGRNPHHENYMMDRRPENGN